MQPTTHDKVGPSRAIRLFVYTAAFMLACISQAFGAAPDLVRAEARGMHVSADTKTRYVAAALHIAPGWHVFWQNPGDSGLAPSVQIVPQGAVGPIMWPAPTRLATPPLASYGYTDTVVLPMPLIGTPKRLRARINWLACRETCVPGHSEIVWPETLWAGDSAEQGQDPTIASALGQVPERMPEGWRITAHRRGTQLQLTCTGPSMGALAQATLYPLTPYGLDENGVKIWGQLENSLGLTAALGRAWQAGAAPLHGVLQLTWQDGAQRSVVIETPWMDGSADWGAFAPRGEILPQGAHKLAHASASPASVWAFVQAMLLACLGGALLNLMPCVFPVLSMKVLAYVTTTGATRRTRRRQAWWYALGTWLSLVGIGCALLALRNLGHTVGWGFQMQSPLFVMALALLMFVVGLVQMGFYTVGSALVGAGQSRLKGDGDGVAFWTGVLAVVVATPCSAPFMGVAVGAALAAPTWMGLALFAAMGLGLGLPYLLLCYCEPVARRLPRPGAWMQRLREATGLCLWGSTIWLLWIAGAECGAQAVAAGVTACLLLGSAAWVARSFAPSLTRLTSIFVFVLVGFYIAAYPCIRASDAMLPNLSAPAPQGGWQLYTKARLDGLRAANKAVFVDFTAAWCVSCKINETLVLETDAAAALFARLGIVRLKADWTDQNAEVAQALATFNRSSVPLYVFYPAGPNTSPLVLPALLTPSVLTRALTGDQAP